MNGFLEIPVWLDGDIEDDGSVSLNAVWLEGKESGADLDLTPYLSPESLTHALMELEYIIDKERDRKLALKEQGDDLRYQAYKEARYEQE